MSITPKTRKVLWTRAGDRCSFPGCSQQLTVDAVDASTGGAFVTVVGEEAHIRSSKIGGPRHEPDFDRAKLDEYENLILLCSTHHSLIDDNDGVGYPVDVLLAMRGRHEQWPSRKTVMAGVVEYVSGQYYIDDKILFEQVDLNGPSVDSMFVDVPFSCRPDATVATVMQRISTERPGDLQLGAEGQITTGAAQALLHPDWASSALVVGGPGQGKSTLLQYICQFHRARLLKRAAYTGANGLTQITEVTQIPIRIDLRDYAYWATARASKPTPEQRRRPVRGPEPRERTTRWPSIEEFLTWQIHADNGGHDFSFEDFAHVISTEPTLIALDGLDEVANLTQRERVSEEIAAAHARLAASAADLVVLVATRPGGTTSALWSSPDFPTLYLQRLSHGLRLQYLRRWVAVAKLSVEAADRLQRTFMDNQHVPHIDELASYPMQLAILLHLLYRRQLLPQQRTELYTEYLKTFLDREQREDKEPLLAEERAAIEKIHMIIAWHLQTSAEQGRSAGTISRQDLKSCCATSLLTVLTTASWPSGFFRANH